jgi:hypothetical protein
MLNRFVGGPDGVREEAEIDQCGEIAISLREPRTGRCVLDDMIPTSVVSMSGSVA